MATRQEFLTRLQTEYPEYWAWLQSRPTALQRIRDLAGQYASAATGSGGQQYAAFVTQVQTLKSYTNWQSNVPTDESGDTPVEEPLPEEEVPAAPLLPEDTHADVRGLLSQFLSDNQLPSTLMSFIESALAQDWSYSEIVTRLRETPEYFAAYPENKLRQANGLSWWPEAQIREYRDQARRISKEYLGLSPTEVTNEEIASLIAKGVDLGEWERRIQTHAAFLQWGPAVKQALSLELGYDVPDERVWAFMNPDIPTPELDLAYRKALMRGQPAVLGFGIRPEEEANIMVQMGLSAEEAFKGYQGIASELPRANRMRMIEQYLGTKTDKFPTNPLEGANQGLLFRAFMLRDAEAYQTLSQMYARETARWQAGGGPAGGGAGLQAPELR